MGPQHGVRCRHCVKPSSWNGEDGRRVRRHLHSLSGARRQLIAVEPPCAAQSVEMLSTPNCGWRADAIAYNIGAQREVDGSDGYKHCTGFRWGGTAGDDRGRSRGRLCAHQRVALAAPPRRLEAGVPPWRRHDRRTRRCRRRVGMRWRWGDQQATIGLIVVTPACQGRRIGHRLDERVAGRARRLQRAPACHLRGPRLVRTLGLHAYR